MEFQQIKLSRSINSYKNLLSTKHEFVYIHKARKKIAKYTKIILTS